MIPIRGLFETHLTVKDLQRSMSFFGEVLGLERLREANVIPLDFNAEPTDEPVVFAWMPAASLFFHDPDGNLLEFLSMLPDTPKSDLGVVGWSHWKSLQANERRR